MLATFTTSHAQWTVTKLNPAGSTQSLGYAVGGGQQAGFSFVGGGAPSLWSKTSASWVSLNPACAVQGGLRVSATVSRSGCACGQYQSC